MATGLGALRNEDIRSGGDGRLSVPVVLDLAHHRGSGVLGPAEPRPGIGEGQSPAPETAEASVPPLCMAIGADITGYASPNSSVNLVRNIRSTIAVLDCLVQNGVASSA